LEYTTIFTVLEQAFYEVGNTIWKEYRRSRIRDPIVVAKLFQEILNNIHAKN